MKKTKQRLRHLCFDIEGEVCLRNMRICKLTKAIKSINCKKKNRNCQQVVITTSLVSSLELATFLISVSDISHSELSHPPRQTTLANMKIFLSCLPFLLNESENLSISTS